MFLNTNSNNAKKCEQNNVNNNNNCFNNANHLFDYCTAVIENRKIDSLSLSLNSTIQNQSLCFPTNLSNNLTSSTLINNNNNTDNNTYLYSSQNSNAIGEKSTNEQSVSWHHKNHSKSASNNVKKISTSLKSNFFYR